MSASLNTCTATEVIQLISRNEVSIQEVSAACLEAVKARDGQVRAWEYLDPEAVMNKARMLDEKRKNGAVSSLCGVPVGVKDVFNTKDMPTTMGSPIWAGFTPGNDARVVHSIRESNGLIFGKTVTAEFAVHYLSSEKTLNPHDPTRIAGTSSSGSAAAIASNMVPLALGTQTAGSIIRPSSYCGVHGFKPSFGCVPRTGTLKTTDTLDTIGCLARSVDDIELLFDLIRVRGRDYPLASNKLRYLDTSKARRTRIGYLLDGLWVFSGFERYALEEFEAYIDGLRKHNEFEVMRFKPSGELAKIHKYHSTIYDKTLSYYFQVEYAGQENRLSAIMKELIEKGKQITPSEYQNALEDQARLGRLIQKEIEQYDVILTLSTAGEAPLRGQEEKPDTCLIWTFLGMPALNVPVFKGPNGLPFGLQVVAKRYDDLKMLQIARLLPTK